MSLVDKETMVSSSQDVTVSAGSTNYINLGAPGDIGMGSRLDFMVMADVAATAVGAATVMFSLQSDSVPAFSSPTTISSTGAIPIATLVPGWQIFMPIPVGTKEQYIRLYYTVTTGPLTAGAFTAAVVEGAVHNYHYPDAI